MARRTTEGYIALHKKIMNWDWYKDANTFRVFVHILLNANFTDAYFLGYPIHRGQIATSYQSIADDLGITYAQARRSISHLKLTGELTVKKMPKFLVISIVSYDRYQTKGQANGQTDGQQYNKYNNSYEVAKRSSQEEKKKKEVFIEQ